MLTSYTEKQKKLIISNLLAACKDIKKLNSTGYKFISNANGFIAHYDIYGFKAHYEEQGSLKAAIEANASSNMYRNFREGERDYEYYMSKKDIYLALLGSFVANEFMRSHFQIIHIGA